MRFLISFLLLIETLFCFSQEPTISFGSIEDSIVTKNQLLLNEGIVFSNDTTDNVKCLTAVDFKFRIVKLNGDTIEIQTNFCRDTRNISKKRLEKREKKHLECIAKGKENCTWGRPKNCYGGDRFNVKQIKAIKKMKPGETVQIDAVKTNASSCSCLGRWWSAGLKYTIK